MSAACLSGRAKVLKVITLMRVLNTWREAGRRLFDQKSAASLVSLISPPWLDSQEEEVDNEELPLLRRKRERSTQHRGMKRTRQSRAWNGA